MCAPGEAQGKRFHIESVDIETQIHTDGSLTISEVRTYQFKGSYSWADYSLPLGNLGPVTGFSVSEETRVYEASSSEDPGTYYTQVEDDKFYARWFFQSRNEIRSFTLRYRLENVVLVYRDTAEFYYQFAGSANQQEIGSVNVSIKLPQPAEFPKVRVWAHGPLHGTVAIENGHIFLAVTPMPRHEFWESRVTFPTHWVPDVASGWAQRLDQIVQKEEEYAREANQRRATQEKREKLAEPIALGLSLLGVIVIGFLLSRYGRGFQVPYQLKIDSEIPSDLHPTLVSYIYHGKQVYSSALAASLFNLACQGILSIEQAGEKPKWWQGGGSRFVFRLSRKNWFSQRDELHDFDNDLIDFFFNKLAKGTDVLSSKELREGGSQMRKWFQKWKKLVHGHVTEPLYDSSSVWATVFAATFSTLIMVSGVLTTILYGEAGFFAMAVDIICLGASFLLLRYTPETKLRRNKWEALKRYLKRYRFTHEEPESWMPQVGHYLVFALALGVGNKAIERMFERIPADERNHFFPWYVYDHGTNPTPSKFASSFTSVISAANCTVSSGAGGGGGASGGAG